MKDYQELEIIRGETPEIPIIIPDYLDLSLVEDIIVSLTQKISDTNIQKFLSKDEVKREEKGISVEFSQKETLGLSSEQRAYIQVNLIYNGGRRLPSKMGVVNVLPNNVEEEYPNE